MEKTNSPIVGTATRVVSVPTNFKTMLYLLVSIAVLFIAIIPAKYVSGMFSQDSTVIFYLSLTGSFALLEFLAWCFLNGAWKIEESRMAKKLQHREVLMDRAAGSPVFIEDKTATSDLETPVEEEYIQAESFKAEKNEEEEEKEEKEEGGQTQDAVTMPASPNYLQLHQAGCEAYYQRLSSKKQQELAAITEYVNFIMAPFIPQERMSEFCDEILHFATDAAYKPKPWKGLKGTLTSFDVRHLIWNITARLGLGKGKPYSTDICAQFIMDMFPDICEGLDFSTLRNLRVTSQTDKIHLDEPKPDCFDFHLAK